MFADLIVLKPIAAQSTLRARFLLQLLEPVQHDPDFGRLLRGIILNDEEAPVRRDIVVDEPADLVEGARCGDLYGWLQDDTNGKELVARSVDELFAVRVPAG